MPSEEDPWPHRGQEEHAAAPHRRTLPESPGAGASHTAVPTAPAVQGRDAAMFERTRIEVEPGAAPYARGWRDLTLCLPGAKQTSSRMRSSLPANAPTARDRRPAYGPVSNSLANRGPPAKAGEAGARRDDREPTTPKGYSLASGNKNTVNGTAKIIYPLIEPTENTPRTKPSGGDRRDSHSPGGSNARRGGNRRRRRGRARPWSSPPAPTAVPFFVTPGYGEGGRQHRAHPPLPGYAHRSAGTIASPKCRRGAHFRRLRETRSRLRHTSRPSIYIDRGGNRKVRPLGQCLAICATSETVANRKSASS